VVQQRLVQRSRQVSAEARELPLEQARAVLRDHLKRDQDRDEKLAWALREIDRLRAVVDSRPTRRQYEMLADELERLRREYAATLARSRRVNGGL
jgi:polyhydroxyalkanoate synthesis regulator phasin